MDNSCKVPEVKPITIKRFGTAGLVPTVPTTLDCNLWQKTDLKDGEFAINTVDDKLYIRSGNQIIELTNQSSGGGTGTVTSVGLSMPSAFAVANSPITSSGSLTVTGAGTTNEYIRGDGSLATFPTFTGITSLNSLTGASQTFATGTSGSDFSISSTGTVHTFNIPTASSSNRGLLSSTDWSTFNNKVSTGAITTSGLTMATASLLGRSTAGSGAVEEITIGSGLSLTGTTLTATGGISGLTANRFVYATGSTTIGTNNDAYFNGTQVAFGTSSPIASTRVTILGSGTTSSTFGLQVHNSTGTNNALVVRDDGFVSIGSASPTARLFIKSQGASVTDIPFRIQNSANTNDLIKVTGNGTTVFNEPGSNISVLQILHNTPNSNAYNVTFQFTHNRTFENIYGGAVQRGFRYFINSTTRNIGFIFASTTGGNDQVYIDGGQNIRIGQGFSNINQPDANATRTLLIANGVAPTTSPTDIIQMYSADVVAGNAAPHFRTENGNVIKIYQETTAVTGATYVSGSGGNIKKDCTFDGYTIQQVVKALRNQGLLA